MFPADQQTDRVLPAVGSPREAGERQEEIGQETTVHAFSILGNLLPLSPPVPDTLSNVLSKCQTDVVSL